MKEALLILIVCASVLMTAVAATRHETKPKSVVQCTCPTLEELLKEKVEKEELERKFRALERRQKIKDALHLN